MSIPCESMIFEWCKFFREVGLYNFWCVFFCLWWRCSCCYRVCYTTASYLVANQIQLTKKYENPSAKHVPRRSVSRFGLYAIQVLENVNQPTNPMLAWVPGCRISGVKRGKSEISCFAGAGQCSKRRLSGYSGRFVSFTG